MIKFVSYKLVFIFFMYLFITSSSSCEDITEPILDNEKVELVAPINGVISKENQQNLFWNSLDKQANYELQVVSPRFDSIVKLILDTTINKNIYSINIDSGSYEWRVRAVNNSSYSKFSDSWKLIIVENEHVE